ncbi:hypothetical protein CR513_14309, partial [Mucuna pruriens]
MGGNKGQTQMWVDQTTFDKENYPKNNSLLLLMEIMFLLLVLAMSNFSPLYPYTMFFVFQNWLTTLSLYIGLYKIGIIRNLQWVRRLELLKSRVGNSTNKIDLPSSQWETLETWVASQIWLYHKRLGHPSFGLLKIMFPHLFTKESVESFKCDVCQFSEHHHVTFSPIFNLLTLFILNYRGQLVTLYRGLNGLYHLLMTHVTWIFLMKHRSEVCQIFVDFFCLVNNQFNKSIKRLRSDNGTKFVNLEFSKFPKDNGVIHELMYVNTPKQNGVAERQNRHLLEVAITLLFQMRSYPATYLINRLPTHVLNNINQIKHILSFFPSSPLMLSLLSRVFRCVSFVHSHNLHHGKLDLRAVKCVFIDYPLNKKQYKCYHLSSRWVLVSMDVTFHETQLFFVSPLLQGESYLEVESIIESLPFPTQDVIECSSSRSHKPTLVLEQVQLFEPKVSIPENPINDVTGDMPIALRKGK